LCFWIIYANSFCSSKDMQEFKFFVLWLWLRIAMLSECLGFWWWQPLLKGTNVRRRQWCANVVRIAMLSVLGFDDGGHCWKEQMWSKKMRLRWCANVVDYAQLYTLCPSSSRAVSFYA
jgi:hypothetical protein